MMGKNNVTDKLMWHTRSHTTSAPPTHRNRSHATPKTGPLYVAYINNDSDAHDGLPKRGPHRQSMSIPLYGIHIARGVFFTQHMVGVDRAACYIPSDVAVQQS